MQATSGQIKRSSQFRRMGSLLCRSAFVLCHPFHAKWPMRVYFDRTVCGQTWDALVLSLNRYLSKFSATRLALRTRRRRSSASDEVSGWFLRVGRQCRCQRPCTLGPDPCQMGCGWPDHHAAAIDSNCGWGQGPTICGRKESYKSCSANQDSIPHDTRPNSLPREAVAQTR